MSEQTLQAGERRTSAEGDLLALSPLPVESGARPADPADWIRRKNSVWMDLQGGALVFAAELSLMFISLAVLSTLLIGFGPSFFAWNNLGHFDWSMPLFLLIGNIFFTAPFGLVIYYNTNKAIKEGPPVRLNRQKREVAIPRWMGGKEIKVPFWDRDPFGFIYVVLLFTALGAIVPFLHEGPLTDFQHSFVIWSLVILALECLIFIPYIVIGLHLHKKHAPKLKYEYHPWEKLVAFVQKQQNLGPGLFTEQTMLTLAVPDPENPESALAAASVSVGHETAGLAQWESIRRYMEDGPEACPDPREYGTVEHYLESCRQARQEKSLPGWLWKKVGDWFFQRYLAHKLTEWRVKHLMPRSLPEDLKEWSQPIPEDRWAKHSETLLKLNSRSKALQKNRRMHPEQLLETLYEETRKDATLTA